MVKRDRRDETSDRQGSLILVTDLRTAELEEKGGRSHCRDRERKRVIYQFILSNCYFAHIIPLDLRGD